MKYLLMIPLLVIAVIGCTTLRDTPVYTEVPPGSGNYVTSTVPITVIDPKFEGTIAGIRATNEASRPVNPWAGLIDYGLGAALLIAAEIARRKNAKANQAQTLLATVIQGVENAPSPDNVKTSIKNVATLKGVETDLGAVVAKITE